MKKNKPTYWYQIDDGNLTGPYGTLEGARHGMREQLENEEAPDADGEYEIMEFRTPRFSSLLDLEEEMVRAAEAGRVVDELERRKAIGFEDRNGLDLFVAAAHDVLDTLFELCRGTVGVGLIEAGHRGRWRIDVSGSPKDEFASFAAVPYAESMDQPTQDMRRTACLTACLSEEVELRLQPKLADEQRRDDLQREKPASAQQQPSRGWPPGAIVVDAGREVPTAGIKAAFEALDTMRGTARRHGFELQEFSADVDTFLKK